jgi:hypothetical protein
MRRSPRETTHRHVEQLSQRRKDLEDPLPPFPAIAPRLRCEGPGVEMLGDRKTVEDGIALRHEGQSATHNPVGVTAGTLAAPAADLDAV